MYRIRLASGEEAVYRTAEELAKAVSSGVVSDTAEIFHKSAERWLPIKLHPDYRAVVTGKRSALPSPPAPAPAPAPPAAVMPRVTPIDQGPGRPEPTKANPRAQPVVLAPVAVAPDPTPTAQPAPEPRPAPPPVSANAEGTRARKLRVMLALALGIAVIAVVGGGAILAWPRVGTWLAQHRSSPPLAEGMPPVTQPGNSDSGGTTQSDPFPVPAGAASRRLDSLPTTYPSPSAPLSLAPAVRDSSAEPDRQETRVSRLTATRAAMPSYFEAYADARSEMDDGFDYVSFRRVFAPSRFAAPDSIRAARRMIAAAGNILRVYRGREVMLEQTYRPDDPGGRGSLREPFETAEAARSLISDTDSLFGLLVSQQGRFSYANQSLRFQDARITRSYNQLRGEILNTLRAWRDSTDATNRVTLPRLLRAFGESLPPVAR